MTRQFASTKWTPALAAVLALILAWPAPAATLTVTSTADDGPGSLRAALAGAADADTIEFAVTLPATIALTSGELLVTNSVTIAGPGQAQLTVDGQQASRVFAIATGKTVAISGLTIANGATSSTGGGVQNAGTLTLSDCTLRDNWATGGGGGVYTKGTETTPAALTITGCTLSGNRAGGTDEYHGGGAVVLAAVAHDSAGPRFETLTIENSLLTNNVAAYGGGIVIDVEGNIGYLGWDDAHAVVTVTNSTLSGNSATASGFSYGGAMVILVAGDSVPSSTAAVMVDNCTWSGNSVAADSGYAMGGAILSVVQDRCWSELILKNSTFSDNSASTLDGNGLGGAIAGLNLGGYMGLVTMENCILSRNRASDSGGAILNAGTLTLTDCTFADNSAANAGGALCNGLWGDATATLTGCQLTGNSVTGEYLLVDPDFIPGGGAIYNGSPAGSSSLAIVDTTVSGNTAQIGGAILTAAIGDEDGGTLYPAATSVSIVRSTLSGNSAISTGDFAGGGAIVQLGLVSVSRCDLALDNSTLAGNWTSCSSNYNALAGAILNVGGDVALNNCTLSDNDDTAGASGIETAGGTLELKNTILANDPSGTNLVYDGGAVLSHGANLSTDDGSGFLVAAGDLVNTDPKLGPLADNGGPTWTCALLAGSPAINAGSSNDIAGILVTTDQRGVPRPQGDGHDIGAFEWQPTAPTHIAQIQQPIDVDGSSTFNAKRGVVPVKFALSAGGAPTCELPPATIAVFRLGGTTPSPVDEATYAMAADSGSNFRVSDCQYIYNLAAKSLGAGTYQVEIRIDGVAVGSATFQLK